MPDVANKTFDDATRRRSSQAASRSTIKRESHDATARRHRDRQDPGRGRTSKPNSTVTLTVSAGARRVRGPDVDGQVVRRRATTLTTHGSRSTSIDEAERHRRQGSRDPHQPGARPMPRRSSVDRASSCRRRRASRSPTSRGLDQRRRVATARRRRLRRARPSRGEQHRPRGNGHRDRPAGGHEGPTTDARSTCSCRRARSVEVTVPERDGQTQADAGATLDRKGLTSSCSSRRRRRERRQGHRPVPGGRRAASRRAATSCSRSARRADLDDHAPRRPPPSTTRAVTRARPAALARWYERHGRHDLPWRATRDRWAVLVVGSDAAPDAGRRVSRRVVARSWPQFPDAGGDRRRRTRAP